MIRLLRVELTRLRWRRAVLLLVLAAIIIPTLVLAARVYGTRPFSDADRAAAEVQADQERGFMQAQVDQCLQNPRRFRVDPDRAERQCARQLVYPVDADNYLYREQLRVARERQGGGLAVVAIVAVLMLLAGTTYVGHDWASGSMSNQLLFESRRLRVWGAKAVAVALLALVVGAVALGIFWGGLLLVAQTRGLDPSSQAVTDILQQAGRGLVLVVAGAVGGYALTTMVRSTVFTIGVLFGVAVAGGLLFGALLPQGALRFEPATNALAVVNGQLTFYVEPPPDCFGVLEVGGDNGPRDDTAIGERCASEARVTQQGGAIYYGVLLSVLGAASAVSFRRRDVP